MAVAGAMCAVLQCHSKQQEGDLGFVKQKQGTLVIDAPCHAVSPNGRPWCHADEPCCVVCLHWRVQPVSEPRVEWRLESVMLDTALALSVIQDRFCLCRKCLPCIFFFSVDQTGGCIAELASILYLVSQPVCCANE